MELLKGGKNFDHHVRNNLKWQMIKDWRPRVWTCMARCAFDVSSASCTIYRGSRGPRWREHGYKREIESLIFMNG